MKYTLIQIFFFLMKLEIELSEGKSIKSNQETNQKKEQKSELINLNDKNFNYYINDGKYNRWLILFYSQTCYFCDRALQILNNILYKNQFKIVNSIKFGKIDVSENDVINFRFNISQVPHIIMIENSSMIELDFYPNENNFLNFIESNFSDSLKVFPIPKNNYFKYYYMSMENSIFFFVNQVNNFLKSFNINYAINPIIFILIYIILCIIFWTIIFKAFMKCCGNKKKEKIEESINSGNVKENKNNLNVKENESNGNENEKIKDIKEEKKYYYHRRKKKKKN